MDVDSIGLGDDFFQAINDTLKTCDVFLAIIGRNWLSAHDEHGRRLDNPDDLVRYEIASALKRGIRVIPILVDGARVPRSTELPADLKLLVRRNAFVIRHESFHADTQRLIKNIESIFEADEIRRQAEISRRKEGRRAVEKENKIKEEAAKKVGLTSIYIEEQERAAVPKKSDSSQDVRHRLIYLFLMTCSLLILLALVSYNPSDNTLVQSYTFGEAFALENNRARNILGLVGATLAYYLIPNFVGISIIMLPITALYIGYSNLKGKEIASATFFLGSSFFVLMVLSALFGWIGTTFILNTSFLSGSAGLAMADYLIRALGEVGGLIMIVSFLLLAVLFIKDKNPIQTFGRIENLLRFFTKMIGKRTSAR